MNQNPARALTGTLGVGSIVFMVVAAAAPLTVVAGAVPLGVALGTGAAFPATFLICAAVLVPFAVGFCAMTRHVPEAGAFYAYIQRGLGSAPGLGAAFLALVTYTAVQAAVYGYLGATLSAAVEQFGGPALPWWAWATVMVLLTGLLGYRNIELSSKVLGVLLVCEVGIVVVFDAVVAVRGGAEGLSTAFVQPSWLGSGSLGIAIMFGIASFIGFEATAVFRDEARDPDRTVPRATYLALGLIAGFYALSSWAFVSAWGDEQAVARSAADPGNILVSTVGNYLGSVGTDVVQILLLTSLFAAVLAFHNVVARYLFSLGNVGAVPVACGRSHAKHRSPHVASMVQSISAAPDRRLRPRRARPGEPGIRVDGRHSHARRPGADGSDLHGRTGVLPADADRRPDLAHRARARSRLRGSRRMSRLDRGQLPVAHRWLPRPGVGHRRGARRRLPAGRRRRGAPANSRAIASCRRICLNETKEIL